MARALRELFGDEHEISILSERVQPHRSRYAVDRRAEPRRPMGHHLRRLSVTRNRAEYAAFRSSRLVGFFLSRGLYKASVAKQTERILALWSTIETLSANVEGGAMFELPMKSIRVRQIKF